MTSSASRSAPGSPRTGRRARRSRGLPLRPMPNRTPLASGDRALVTSPATRTGWFSGRSWTPCPREAPGPGGDPARHQERRRQHRAGGVHHHLGQPDDVEPHASARHLLDISGRLGWLVPRRVARGISRSPWAPSRGRHATAGGGRRQYGASVVALDVSPAVSSRARAGSQPRWCEEGPLAAIIGERERRGTRRRLVRARAAEESARAAASDGSAQRRTVDPIQRGGPASGPPPDRWPPRVQSPPARRDLGERR